MPELPEIAALAERLSSRFQGAPLSGVTPLQFSALKTVVPGPDTLLGRPLGAIGYRGKYLVLEFGGPRILIHLSQGGRVDVEDPAKTTRPKGAVVRFVFEGAGAMLIKEYGTERKAGFWVVDAGDDGPMSVLGPDITSAEGERLLLESDDRRRIHTLLRDQRTVAGVGRGYSDDILHAARLSPYATLASLGAGERARLVEAVRQVLADGLAAERRRTGGLPTKVGDHWIVHGRAGQPCPRCGADLRRISYESHEVTYCPPCQTGGKVLADRRLSRLVR
ncbi:MAG: DNA-formamidopyrimidine glycosylase family protein [Acidimicrobiia bacterium]